ncbi:MAG: hypothetical protein CM1200mP18_20380 [Gammaproteobacteria bacterium]|nr:MAG: hypothetical protein CM1200mP18_20380 [Gammaproteobacteria bacterium]
MDSCKITEDALSRLNNCDDPRLKEVMTSVITHLHGVVKDVSQLTKNGDRQSIS